MMSFWAKLALAKSKSRFHAWEWEPLMGAWLTLCRHHLEVQGPKEQRRDRKPGNACDGCVSVLHERSVAPVLASA